jgi:hypothetical protein
LIFTRQRSLAGKRPATSGVFVLPYKPGALHPVASAPIKALTCFCLFGLWQKRQVTRFAGGRPKMLNGARKNLSNLLLNILTYT